jgi:hypothetical protein
MHRARTLAVPMWCWVMPMHQTTDDGLFLASISAAMRTADSGTPVTSDTLSGVHLATSLRTSSKPQVRAAMYSLSSQPLLKMCHRMPHTSGMSVPGRTRT